MKKKINRVKRKFTLLFGSLSVAFIDTFTHDVQGPEDLHWWGYLAYIVFIIMFVWFFIEIVINKRIV